MIDDYFAEALAAIAASPAVVASNVTSERRSDDIGYLRGDLTMQDGSSLHFREFVQWQPSALPEKYMYVYHYQNADGELIFRYDNSGHYSDLPDSPHHKHIGETGDVIPAPEVSLLAVLREIEQSIPG
jgi:hypothetical protein